MLLSLKIECCQFPALPPYLPMSVRQETCPNCGFEKLVGDVVKALIFTAFSLIPPATNEEGPQGHLAYRGEAVSAYSQSEYGVQGWSLFFQLT